MSNPLDEIRASAEASKYWPAFYPRLRQYFLAKQRQFSTEHKGDYEEIGRFVAYTTEIMEDLEKMNFEVSTPKPKHKPLNRPT